jgi:uncharacterized protein with GYD domain
MPTYIKLGRWTQQGIEKVKESPARLDAFKQLVKSVGGEVKAVYMVTGQYDILTVIEAPSDAPGWHREVEPSYISPFVCRFLFLSPTHENVLHRPIT